MDTSRIDYEDYRPNVCAVILDQTGSQVLLCHRIGFALDEGWQFPQGGYNPTLDLVDEMCRELREEISSDAVEVIKVSKKEYFYDFPHRNYRKKSEGYKGQRQTWVLCQLVGSENAINVNTSEAEFDQWIWTTPIDAVNRVVDFKRTNYQNALIELGILSDLDIA